MFVTLTLVSCHFVTLISETQSDIIVHPNQFCQLLVTASGKKKEENWSERFLLKEIREYPSKIPIGFEPGLWKF